LCGYVGVPPTHKHFGKHYNDLYEEDPSIEAHGGITWSGDLPKEIPGAPTEGYWWFGFDCAHTWDFVPGVLEYASKGFSSAYTSYAEYRTIDFVKTELESLAKQLKE